MLASAAVVGGVARCAGGVGPLLVAASSPRAGPAVRIRFGDVGCAVGASFSSCCDAVASVRFRFCDVVPLDTSCVGAGVGGAAGSCEAVAVTGVGI